MGFLFFRQKFVEIGCTACLSIKIWLLITICFQRILICIFCFISASVQSVKGKLG